MILNAPGAVADLPQPTINEHGMVMHALKLASKFSNFIHRLAHLGLKVFDLLAPAWAWF